MRCGAEANKRTFYYATYTGKTAVYDENNNYIGDKPAFSNPVKCRGNISPAKGASDAEVFGVSADYDKTINPLPLNFPATETSVFWIDTMPTLSNQGATQTPYDYIVSRVAVGISHKAYALKKVAVTNG